MGFDFVQPAKAVNGDESLGTFVSRRLGREAYENLIEPLMSGIYAGDGDQLSLASTFPYLRDLEIKYGSLARGALKMRAQSNGKAVQGSRSAFLTPTTGLAEIVEALVESLKVKWRRPSPQHFRHLEYLILILAILWNWKTAQASTLILSSWPLLHL